MFNVDNWVLFRCFPRQKNFYFFDLKFDRGYYFNLDAFLNSIADIILTWMRSWMRSYTKMLINLS